MLLMDEGSILKTHYDTLSIKEDAGFEEIRASYKSAVLSFHPDKLQRKDETSNHPHQSQDKFLNVQKAWEILRDSETRAQYDQKVQAARRDMETVEDIRLEEMTIENAGEVLELFHQCRCGDYFAIDSSELEEMGYSLESVGNKPSIKRPDSLPISVILPCGSCSLKIQLIIDAYE